MKIVYLGTPDFAVAPLRKILECANHKVVGVVTNKDKPVGRKKVLTAPPVKVLAQENNLPVFQYDKIRLEGVEDMSALKPDLMMTCAFGQILSQEILDIPKFGVINIHASLLPKYRGASPIHYAILNGEKTTGITIMKTDIGIDTGDIILQKTVDILDGETCGELFDRLATLGAECIVEALNQIENNTERYISQDDKKSTLTKIIKKEDAFINWSNDNIKIYNQIRAFNPAPIAFTLLNGQPFKIYSAEISDKKGECGVVLESNGKLIVGCGNGSISLKRVQKAGGNALDISDFLRGNKINVGEVLGK